jgi:hypothetical protein
MLHEYIGNLEMKKNLDSVNGTTMADYPYLQENQCGTYIRDEGTQGV